MQAFALLDARHNGDIHVQRHPVDIGPDEASYQQTLALADALGMRPLKARCHRRLGTLYGRMGRAQQACAALGTAIDLYRAMEMTFWLSQAEASLAQVGAASETSAGWGVRRWLMSRETVWDYP